MITDWGILSAPNTYSARGVVRALADDDVYVGAKEGQPAKQSLRGEAGVIAGEEKGHLRGTVPGDAGGGGLRDPMPLDEPADFFGQLLSIYRGPFTIALVQSGTHCVGVGGSANVASVIASN